VTGVHHDWNTDPARVCTAMVYLSDVVHGGETFSPCAGGLDADDDADGADGATLARGDGGDRVAAALSALQADSVLIIQQPEAGEAEAGAAAAGSDTRESEALAMCEARYRRLEAMTSGAHGEGVAAGPVLGPTPGPGPGPGRLPSGEDGGGGASGLGSGAGLGAGPGAGPGAVPSAPPPPPLPPGVVVCSGPGGEPGVLIRPMSGRAVLFEHMPVAGAWHAPCVVRGSGLADTARHVIGCFIFLHFEG
jgi:hypothetical protein